MTNFLHLSPLLTSTWCLPQSHFFSLTLPDDWNQFATDTNCHWTCTQSSNYFRAPLTQLLLSSYHFWNCFTILAFNVNFLILHQNIETPLFHFKIIEKVLYITSWLVCDFNNEKNNYLLEIFNNIFLNFPGSTELIFI